MKSFFIRATESIKDYNKRIGNPHFYATKIIPTIIEKCKKPDEFEIWDQITKEEINRYKKKQNDNLTSYISYALPKIIKNCENSNIYEIAISLIKKYDLKYGNCEVFIENSMAKLLLKIKNIKDMRKIAKMIESYSNEIGDPSKYVSYALVIGLDKKESELEKWDKLIRKMKL